MERNRMFRRGLALLLLVTMAVGLMPGFGRPLDLNAAASDKTIAGFGTDAIANPRQPENTGSTWAGSYVYFGSYDGKPVKYRVLSKSTTDFGEAAMLLDCDSRLWKGEENNWYNKSTNKWNDSGIKKYLNNEFLRDRFSSIERNAIANSTKAAPGSGDGKGGSYLAYEPLRGEQIFLLDAKEATNTSYGYNDIGSNAASRKKTGDWVHWWLRSPEGEPNDSVGYVNASGQILSEPLYDFSVPDYEFNVGVSPAFNVKLSSILFSSVISGEAEQADAEYKLTLLDNNMNIAADGDITRSGDTITIPYIISGANAGNATQVSVLILNQEYTAGNINSANVLAYEKLNAGSGSESGTGTFVFPAELSGEVCGTDYFIYLVAEEVNDQKETDYASEPAAIHIQETKKVNSVQVMLDAPAASHPFDTTAECGTEGVKNVSAAWMDAGAQPISGHAGYNGTYILRLTIIPADGYVLDTSTLIQLNDGSRTVENITQNPNDGSLSGTVTFQTAKARLLSISEPAAVTGIANGTEKTATAFGLPDTVTIETEDDTVTTAAIVWKMNEITQEEYDPSIRSRAQVFTVHGTITLPEQIDNPEGINLGVSIKATVLAAGFVGNLAADPPEGTYIENQKVALRSSTEDAEIYYTTKDITPDQANGIKYTGVIPVTGIPGESVTTTIRAIAVKDGMQDSGVAAFVYTINLPALKYAVTVQNGTGSGEYEQGQTVTITANDPGEGKQFKGWNVEKGAIILADRNAATTTFTMPAEEVRITAAYADKLGIPGILDNPGNPDKPGIPIILDNPGNPDKPNKRDTPNGPDNQNRPDNRNIPVMSYDILWADSSGKDPSSAHEAEESGGNLPKEHKSPKTGDTGLGGKACYACGCLFCR